MIRSFYWLYKKNKKLLIKPLTRSVSGTVAWSVDVVGRTWRISICELCESQTYSTKVFLMIIVSVDNPLRPPPPSLRGEKAGCKAVRDYLV